MQTIHEPSASIQFPLVIRQNSDSFVIRDHANTTICTVEYENEPARANALRGMDEETARRMAKRIARLLTES